MRGNDPASFIKDYAGQTKLVAVPVTTNEIDYSRGSVKAVLTKHKTLAEVGEIVEDGKV